MDEQVYDIVDNFESWTPTDDFVVRFHPRRMFFQFWKPKVVYPQIFQKLVDGEMVRVAIFKEHGQITYAESIENV